MGAPELRPRRPPPRLILTGEDAHPTRAGSVDGSGMVCCSTLDSPLRTKFAAAERRVSLRETAACQGSTTRAWAAPTDAGDYPIRPGACPAQPGTGTARPGASTAWSAASPDEPRASPNGPGASRDRPGTAEKPRVACGAGNMALASFSSRAGRMVSALRMTV